VLVVEGSIPNEHVNGDGYWTSMGNDPATGLPITLNQWLDRLARCFMEISLLLGTVTG